MIKKRAQVHQTKLPPPPLTSNVNVNYHNQCTFKLVFTMLPYRNIQI